MKDYCIYRFTYKENITIFLQGFVIILILGYMFYQSAFGVIILSPAVLFYRKEKRNKRIAEQKWQLNIQFKDSIQSLSAALSSGYSVEHAFSEVYQDLQLLYDEDTFIMQELTYIINQLRMNITVERILSDFGERSGIDDIISFAEIFTAAKRSGGDLIKIIKTTGNTIGDKIEVKREIITLITAKKYEASIMKIIPLGILCYLTISSPGFLDPLYHNLPGIAIMTVLLGCYAGAYFMAEKIVAIEV
ncbi:MAG: putative rane protein [Herbinix sp.]|jgi:tight adherence protein B|nr:putative rane protein [Herbinix sp.]